MNNFKRFFIAYLFLSVLTLTAECSEDSSRFIFDSGALEVSSVNVGQERLSAEWRSLTLADKCSQDSPRFIFDSGVLEIPSVRVGQTTLSAELRLVAVEPLVQFELVSLSEQVQQIVTNAAVYQTESQLLSVPLCIQSGDLGVFGYQLNMQLIPGVDPVHFALIQLSDHQGQVLSGLTDNQGALSINDATAFDSLSVSSCVPGVMGSSELKFMVFDVDSDQPLLVFMNSKQTPFHYDFVRNVFHLYDQYSYDDGNALFIAETYFREKRRHLAGSIVAYDAFYEGHLQERLYTLEFWSTDPVPQSLIELAYQRIQTAMPFLAGNLAYHPVGNTHSRLASAFSEEFAEKNIRIIDSEQLFNGLTELGVKLW